MAKIIINYKENDMNFNLESELKKQLRRKSTTWQDMKDCAEELTAKIKDCEENLQQSDNTVLENGRLSMKHQREMRKLSQYTTLLATLVNYMSKVALKEAEKPVAGV